MMKKILSLLLAYGWCAAACAQLTTYYKLSPTAPNEEDCYLKIARGQNEGYFYGTSDEFVPVREGYRPGFFAAEMTDMAWKGDTLTFTLHPKSLRFANKSVTPYNEKVSANFPQWPQQKEGSLTASFKPVYYKGFFSKGERLFILEGTENYEDWRTFKFDAKEE